MSLKDKGNMGVPASPSRATRFAPEAALSGASSPSVTPANAWTPGPWVAGDNLGRVVGGGGEFVAVVTRDIPAGKANASLIAAAPDLYEALAAICEDLADGDETSAEQIARHAGRAALAKARGE